MLADWKNFLTNNENKEQLIDVMSRVWSEEEFRQKMEEKNVILIKQGEAFKLTSNEVTPIPSLRSNQEETDSELFCTLYLLHHQDTPMLK